jgi:hypothetical protein
VIISLPKAKQPGIAKKGDDSAAASAAGGEEEEEVLKSLSGILPAPADNTGRTLKGETTYHNNPPEVLAKHLKETGGKWRTRFPVSDVLPVLCMYLHARK